MNGTQRLYDTRLKMITNENYLQPRFFFRSLDLIRARKTMYPKYEKFYLKTKPQIPYKTNYVIENNKKFNEKVDIIMKKKIVPKINNIFIELEQRLMNNKKKNRDNKARALTLENEKYSNRVMTQRPIIKNAKYLNQLYSQNHDKYLEILLRPSKLRNKMKIKNEKSWNIRTNLPFKTNYRKWYESKLRVKTENNDSSKENHVELNEHKRNEIVHNRPGYLYINN